MPQENEQPAIMPEIVPAADQTDDPARPRGHEIIELIRRHHPEVYAKGLPMKKAVWFAIDRNGKIRKSWIGPDLHINRPRSEIGDPHGSAEAQRAAAERERIQQEEIRVNVPDMHIQSGYFVGVQSKQFPFPGLVAHFITESPGTPHPLGMSIAEEAVVSAAIRSELPPPTSASP